MTKICSMCEGAKPLDAFAKNKNMKDGLAVRCRACNAATSKAWREANPARFKENIQRWKAKNPDYAQKANREWYEANAEYAKSQARKWAKDNPEKAYARNARRRAREASQALPLTQKQQDAIKHLYAFAKYLTKKFGTAYHVDHIVPLKGKEVSGLHVPWNLQILSAKQNLSKSNKLDF